MTGRLAYPLAFAAVLLTAPVTAQEAASTFADLPQLLKPGDTVSVVNAAGRTMKGTLEKLSASSLDLSIPSETDSGLPGSSTVTLAADDIRTIRHRIDDPLSNGIRNGFLFGAVLGGWAGASGGRSAGDNKLSAQAALLG